MCVGVGGMCSRYVEMRQFTAVFCSQPRQQLSVSVVSDSFSPMDCSPPDSSAHVISQTEILECTAISFSRGFSNPRIQPVALRLLHWQADLLPSSA